MKAWMLVVALLVVGGVAHAASPVGIDMLALGGLTLKNPNLKDCDAVCDSADKPGKRDCSAAAGYAGLALDPCKCDCIKIYASPDEAAEDLKWLDIQTAE